MEKNRGQRRKVTSFAALGALALGSHYFIYVRIPSRQFLVSYRQAELRRATLNRRGTTSVSTVWTVVRRPKVNERLAQSPQTMSQPCLTQTKKRLSPRRLSQRSITVVSSTIAGRQRQSDANLPSTASHNRFVVVNIMLPHHSMFLIFMQ